MVAAVRIARTWWQTHPVWGWGIVSVLTVALVVSAFVLSASGATMNVVPTAGAAPVTDNANWVASAGNKSTAVSAVGGAYLYNGTWNSNTNAEIVLAIDDATDSGPINSVTMWVRARDLSTRGVVATGYVGGVSAGAMSLYTTAAAPYTLTGTLSDFSVTLTPPGGSWDYTEIANLTAGLKPYVRLGSNNQVQVDAIWFAIDYTAFTATTVTVGDNTGKDPAATNVQAGQTNVSVDAFTLQRTAGNKPATVSALQVTSAGTPATDVSAVDIYLDNNNDGLYDAGDTKLNTTSGTFSGATSTVTLTTPRAITGLENFIVVYTFAGGAVDAHSVTGQISGATTTNVDTLTDNDDAGGLFTVRAAAAVTIGNGTSDPASQNVSPGVLSLIADRFRVERTANSGSASILTVTVNNAGTSPCTTAYIYTDANNDGGIAGETLLGSSAFAGANAAVDIADQTAGAIGVPAYYIVCIDVGAGTDGQTIIPRVSAATASGFPSPVLTLSDTATTFTILNSTDVTLGDGANDPIAGTVTPGSTYAVDQFTTQRTAGSNASTLNTVTVTKTGAAAITTAYIYTDANGNGVIDGADASIGSASFSGATATIDIPDQTIDGTLRSYLVIYLIDAAAADGQTTTAEVTAATYSNIDNFTESDNVGSTFTVSVPTSITIGDGTDPSASPSYVSTGDTNRIIDQFSLVKSGPAATTVTHLTVTKTGTMAVAASGVKIYTDSNGNGVIDGADASIGSGTFPAGDPVSITIDVTDQTVTTAPAYYLVTYDVSASATDNSTATCAVTSATYAGATSLTNNDTGTYVITVQHTAVVLGDNAAADPAAANVAPGQLNVSVDAFSLQRTQGTKSSSVTDVTVTKTGAAPIGAVDIYSDANGNGVIDGADASLGSGTFAGNVATVDIVDQAINGTAKYFTVVYDLGGTATDGQTTTAEITAFTRVNVDVWAENDNVGSTFTVFVATNVALGDGANDPAAASVSPGQLGVAVDQFTTQRTQGTKASTLNTVTVMKTGAAGASAAYIYSDANGNGVVDGADASIASGTFAGNTATIDIPDQTVDGTLRSYLVVYDISGASTDGQVTTAEITAATYSNVDNFTESDDAGATFTVRHTAAVIGDGTADPGPGSATPGQNGLVADRFRIERTAGSQPASVDSVTVTNSGSAPLGTAYVYTDANNDGSISGETVLGSAAFAGASATIDVNPDQALGAVAAPAYYLVVVDVGAASDGRTIVVAVTAATGSGTPAPGFTYSDTAAAFTVSATPDTEAPTVPTGVAAVAGVASPVIATITWNASIDNIAVTGYKVWRSTTAGGVYAEIGTTNAATLTFNDTTGVTGQEYFYKVSARDAVPNWSALSSVSSGVTATWVPPVLPHSVYAVTTRLCKICHDPHAASAVMILRGGTEPNEAATCYTCHDGTNGANVKTGATNSFALSSGHTVESATTDPDLTNDCSGCHNPHRDYATEPGLPGKVVNGVTIDATPNAWCLACHNATNDWYGAGYPASSAPSVDDTGYPTLGTFPTSAGFIAYTDDAANAHATMPASPAPADPERVQGDCLYCHNSHRGASDYDALVADFGASEVADPADPNYRDYAALCFKCHGDNDYGFATPASDIEQYVMSGGERSGHRIKTAGGTYDVGTPLPCYECHNAHGSARGNVHMFNDALGQNLATSTAVGDEHLVREFCFTCHTTPGDAAAGDGLPYGWDSVGAAYAPVAAGTEVAGLTRDAAIGTNVVRLPETNGHYRDDTASCYKCHGSMYGSPTANNVHNPSGGVSQGGEPCYNCHTAYQDYMEDGTAPKVGSQRTSVYHHVLGGVPGAGYKDGDFAPAVAADLTGYPTGFANGIFCLTCHVDHDKFNATPGANLRRNATSTADGAPYTTNTDYDPTAPFNGGLCTSCHGLALGRDVTDQAAASNPMQSVDAAAYNNSVHQYKVSSEFGAGNTFLADCSKCHNDEQVKEFQTSTNTFGTHWSAEKSLLTALGGTASDPMGETHCYGCHSGNAAGADGYGEQPDYGSGPVDMTKAARSIEVQFGLLSKHPVVPNAGNSVECGNCHNPHEVSLANRVSDPANTYASHTYSTDAQKSAFCLKCHSAAASLPTYTVSGSATLVPSTVTIAPADQPAMNKAGNAARGHWSTVGAISAAEQVNCAECHDNHGSTVVKLLGTYDANDGKNYIGATEITANSNVVCTACHSAASTAFPAGEAQRDANGYLNTGTWPGNTVYDTAYVAGTHSGSPHTSAQATNGYAAGDCKNCHDVHGTAYQYDELVGQFDPTSGGNDQFALCFSCHDGTKGADIKGFYPAAAGGTSVGNRSGHRVLSDTSALPSETLSQGESVGCYNCHNPHGSGSPYALQVRDIGDEPGDAFDVTNGNAAVAAVEMRHFCFACHVPSDVNEGWADTGAGAGWVGLTTETVEGITRTSGSYALKLPAISEHTKANASDCMECHSNPHEPTGGVSNGGTECLTCHSDKSAMQSDNTVFHHVLDAANPDVAPNANNTYPTSETDLACVSCHTDHNNFNAAKASNLRANINSNSGALAGRTNTDFIAGFGAANNYDDGICLGCHYASRTKSASQKVVAGGATETPFIADDGFNASAHQYAINDAAKVGYDGTAAFQANCSKCHDDEQDAGSKQDGTYLIGTHYSARQHLLAALGGAPDANGLLAEEHCYGCHTGGAAGNDVYGVKAMTQEAKATEAQFALTSRHPVVAAGGDAVECESCHNAHTVQSTAGNRVSDPDNTYNLIAYSDVTNQPAFCLKCHDGTLPAKTVTGATYIPYAVTQASTSINNKSDATMVSKGHWTTSGSIAAGERVSCAICHDNHGSAYPKLLGAFNAATSANTVNGEAITGNNNTVCDVAGCHASASAGTSYTRDAATGYPTATTFPGMTVYNTGIHTTMNGGGSSSLPAASAGDCKVCHDVHGTTSTWDEIRGVTAAAVSFDEDTFSLCFDCHDSDGPSTRNIAALYPVATGGTNNTSTNAGHKIKTAGAGPLAVGDALPCYDCHNPHGSGAADGLVVESMIGGTKYFIGDVAGEISLASDAGVRRFCFTCHATATGRGTSSTGAGYTAIAATDLVEGISRNPAVDNNALKLSALAAHTEADTRTCLQASCHGTMTAASTTNVHSPSSGAGGGPCLDCHGAASTERLDKMLPSDTTTYHHVLEATNGDQMTYDGTPANTEVYCLSCHVDHANFNGAAGNLRGAFNDSPTGAFGKSTDFPGDGQAGDGTAGVCLSCHVAALTKAGGQKAGGSATTPAITQAAFDASAHEYVVNDAAKVGYDTSPFLANCIKCHDDGATGPAARQDGTYKLAPHTSAEDRIAQALGSALAGTSTATEENLCFRCHTGAGPNDGYGVKAMDAASRAVNTQFTSLAYTHDVDVRAGLHRSDETQAQISANKHVECEDCHNPHAAGSTNNVAGGADGNQILAGSPIAGVTGIAPTYTAAVANTATLGTRWVAPTGYTSVASSSYEYQICLKCHSAANTNLASWGGAGADAWTNVAFEFNPDNASYHPVMAPTKDAARITRSSTWYRAPWTNIGTQTMMCTDCHQSSTASSTAQGPHGSAVKHMLRGYWPTNNAAGTGTLYTLGGSYTNLLCDTCHNMATIDGLWRAHGSHGGETCIECHIVVQHGSALYGLCGDSDGTMPARYAYQANKANSGLSGYSGDPTDSGSCEGNGCGRHSNNTTAWDW